jgi:curved DNA-binding protein CbpA
METLYDLLGALPRDDAEGLRIAFRKAVKSTHPDLNPGDPDAGQKFRQIVRAQEILLDGEQRAMYDHLLALAKVEAAEDAEQAVDHARAGKIHKLASWVMAVAGASAVSIGGLAVATLLWTSTEPAADTNSAADIPVVASDSPDATKVATVAEASISAPAAAAQTAPASPAETTDGALPPLAPPLEITPPAETQAYERMRGFDRAFADISHAKHPDKAGRGPTANAKKKGPVSAEINARAVLPEPPPPPRRTAAYDASHQESAAPFSPRP